MFQAVPPPIIRSSKLYTQRWVFVELFLLFTAIVSWDYSPNSHTIAVLPFDIILNKKCGLCHTKTAISQQTDHNKCAAFNGNELYSYCEGYIVAHIAYFSNFIMAC